MKKVLSFILGTVFSFFSVGNLNITRANDGVEFGGTQASKTIDGIEADETIGDVESGEAQADEAIDSVEVCEAQPDETVVAVVVDKEAVEKDSRSDSKYYNGLKNIINHPFQIMLRAGGWAILGALTGFIVPAIGAPIASAVGLACGAISKAVDLYENGYNKD